MKITLNEKEMFDLLKESFPAAMIPIGYEVTGVEQTGPTYSKEYTIKLSKKEENP